MLNLKGKIVGIGDVQPEELELFNNSPRVLLDAGIGAERRHIIIAGLTKEEAQSVAQHFFKDATLNLGLAQ